MEEGIINSSIRSRGNPDLIIIVTLLAFAFLSRFYGISQWDLVGDENFTATLAHERYTSLVNPAYYSLVVVSYHLFGHEVWISRLPALMMSIISVPALYLTWSKVIGKRAALFAAVIVIFSSWHLWYSQFARHYIGVFLFSSLAYCYFYRALLTDRLSHLALAVAFSLVTVLFHITAVWVPISSAIAYFTILFLAGTSNNYSTRIIKVYLLICLVTLMVATPLLFSVLNDRLATQESWGYGSMLIVPQLIKYVQIPIVISALFGWLLLVKNEPVGATCIAIAIGIPVLFLVFATPFMPMSPAYAYSILPLVIVLAGFACEEVRKALADYSKLFSYFTLMLLIISLLPSYVSHFLDRKSLNFGSVVQIVEKHHRDGDRILSFVPGFRNKTSRAFEMLPFVSFERDTTINWTKELDDLLSAGNRTWIILSSKRKPIAPELESWLLCHSRLVWQKYAVRIDYEINGYQLFLVPAFMESNDNLNECIK